MQNPTEIHVHAWKEVIPATRSAACLLIYTTTVDTYAGMRGTWLWHVEVSCARDILRGWCDLKSIDCDLEGRLIPYRVHSFQLRPQRRTAIRVRMAHGCWCCCCLLLSRPGFNNQQLYLSEWRNRESERKREKEGEWEEKMRSLDRPSDHRVRVPETREFHSHEKQKQILWPTDRVMHRGNRVRTVGARGEMTNVL